MVGLYTAWRISQGSLLPGYFGFGAKPKLEGPLQKKEFSSRLPLLNFQSHCGLKWAVLAPKPLLSVQNPSLIQKFLRLGFLLLFFFLLFLLWSCHSFRCLTRSDQVVEYRASRKILEGLMSGSCALLSTKPPCRSKKIGSSTETESCFEFEKGSLRSGGLGAVFPGSL